MRHFPNQSFLVTVSALAALTVSPLTTAEQLSASARMEAAKNRMLQQNSAQQTVPNNNMLHIHQGYGRTIVMGVMQNNEDIHADGISANAAGTQLNIGDTDNRETNNVTGDRIDIGNAPGSVYVRVHTINRGNISADSAGFDANASAAGSQINIDGARGVVSINARTTNQGDISANASGMANVEADAAATQINIKGNPSLIHVDGTTLSHGDITAKARGGVAATLDREW